MSQNPSPKTKKDGGGGNNCNEDDRYYGQDSDKWHRNRYRYNSDSVRMFDSIGIIEPDAPQNRSLSGVGKATRKKIWGALKGGQYYEILVQRNKDFVTVGPSSHGHGQTFGSNGGGTLAKGVLNFCSLRHPGGEEETSLTL